MKYTKRSMVSGRFQSMELPITAEQISAWQHGELVQTAFPNLTAEQREFIITGITPEEWDNVFADPTEETNVQL